MRKDFLILSDSEEFVLFARRYFDNFFLEYGYAMCLEGKGSYEIIRYKSEKLNQSINLVYDFLRSDKPYYQIYVEIERKRLFVTKMEIIEVLDYFKGRKEPQTIEETLSLIKEFFNRYFLPVIQGEVWIDKLNFNKDK